MAREQVVQRLGGTGVIAGKPPCRQQAEPAGGGAVAESQRREGGGGAADLIGPARQQPYIGKVERDARVSRRQPDRPLQPAQRARVIALFGLFGTLAPGRFRRGGALSRFSHSEAARQGQ
jgi:hypothetical protein